MGMESCRCDFHGHAQTFHVGGALYNFIVWDSFVNPIQNPACPAGGFLVWTGMQGADYSSEAIVTLDADMVALGRRNAVLDQIVQAKRVILRVIFGPLTTQREMGTCLYLLRHLLGTQFPLVKDLEGLIVAIDEKIYSFSGQMVTSHRCTALA